MKKLTFLLYAIAVIAIAGANVWSTVSNYQNEAALNLADVEIIAEGEAMDINGRKQVTYWYEWGETRSDGSGWRKKECYIGYSDYSDDCIVGDATYLSWGPSGASTKEKERYYSYGSGKY